MSLSDPIADMLLRIRNAQQALHPEVEVPYSRIKADVLAVLKAEGYIQDISIEGEGARKVMKLRLKYTPDGSPVMTGLRRESKCGLRSYRRADALPRVLSGLGVAVISTPQGIMTAKEAGKRHLGGEVLCSVW